MLDTPAALCTWVTTSQGKAAKAQAAVVELSLIFSPKLTLPLQTQRLVCVPALAGLALAQGWLCEPRAPRAADGLGGVAAQCQHCLWPPSSLGGLLALPPLLLLWVPSTPKSQALPGGTELLC